MEPLSSKLCGLVNEVCVFQREENKVYCLIKTDGTVLNWSNIHGLVYMCLWIIGICTFLFVLFAFTCICMFVCFVYICLHYFIMVHCFLLASVTCSCLYLLGSFCWLLNLLIFVCFICLHLCLIYLCICVSLCSSICLCVQVYFVALVDPRHD